MATRWLCCSVALETRGVVFAEHVGAAPVSDRAPGHPCPLVVRLAHAEHEARAAAVSARAARPGSGRRRAAWRLQSA
ncbi:unnamed protein product [Euphydryas editha]|uniref:Uncharacterized protein n=1 Tax=Euphydryas editha TaxID=104508 RepID=A0AAU9U151_EUPED|nr:unnamed protein product [Euphydryas editha]